MLSQITSPSIFWLIAVKAQSAPFAPDWPQPRWLALPVQRRKYSLLSVEISTFESTNSLSVLVV